MKKILLLFVCLSCVAQSRVWADGKVEVVHAIEQKTEKTIHGVVLNDEGEVLPGASILVKGTKNGTITNFDGIFQLPAKEGQVLVVSFLGMKTQEVTVGKKAEYQIRLEADSKALDEVVVTGYQTLSKERSTGSFAKVSAKTLEMKRMENLSSVLEGQVAGYVDGKIRGVTTMNAIANPMVVIDGFPVENTSINRLGETTESMPDMNPEDIESITVLKDAAAASIYGARAANGVIVITTKKAKQGKADVSFSSTFTVQPYSYYVKNRTDAADMIDLQREWAMSNSALMAGGESASKAAAEIRENGAYSKGVDILLDMYTNKISMEEGNRMLNNLAGMGYNYYDQVKKYAKRNPFYQQYNVRVGKTTDRNTFNFSTSYWKNRFADVHNDEWKLGVNITNSLKITNWLQFDAGIYLKYGEQNTQSYNMYNPGFSAMPYDAIVAPDGSYVSAITQNKNDRDEKINSYGLYDETITPMNELGYQLGKNKVFETRAYAKLKVDFTSWLNYNIMFQYETADDKTERLQEIESNSMRTLVNNFTTGKAGALVYNLPNGDAFSMAGQGTTAYNFRQQLNLNKTFYEKHNLVWILGQEIRHTLINTNSNIYYGYDSELLSWGSYNEKALSSFSSLLGYNSLNPAYTKYKRELMNRFVSFYSNGSYTFDDKYVLSGSIRWDRSNLWGTSSKYQNKPLWSVGGSWNIDKESFFHADFVNMLKMRVSYGVGGNIGRNTAPYLVANYFSSSINDGIAGNVSSPPNPDIRWEKTKTTNIGFDFSLFKNRLSGSVEYYNKSSVDLLANTKLSGTQGFGYGSIMTNNGEMTNRGFELTLQGDVIRKKHFTWNATILYALNKNNVKYANNTTDLASSMISMPTTYPTVGEPLYGLYAFKWAGLSEKGDPQIYNDKGEVVSTNVTSSKALYYCGTTIPVHSGTFTNVFRYRDFELSAMLTFAAGHKLRGTDIPNISMANGQIVSTYKNITNRWKQAGDEANTDVPRLVFSNDTDNYNTYRTSLYQYSDLFVYNASNIRIKNISLAYRLPAAWCKKAFLSGAKLQFNVENLATIAFDSKARYDLNAYNAPNYVWGLYLNF